ncbi:MAG: radical SAM family heme chaperone HemW [Oscillospiraceae bacterium]|nr:radical SAM family heme chaperone HemW [Oscillospiraceae bacterium]
MEKMLGIYVHIPFCSDKCGYCDFCSKPASGAVMSKYHHALLKHITGSSAQLSAYYTDSLYFGGGTPSYYGARRICELFNALKRSGRILKSSEVTVEMNPESTKRRELELLRKEGVNRLSIGVQSANDGILKLLGRRHSYKQAEQAFKLARSEGFTNISIDLMYGLPSQTKNDWADTLAKALVLKPDHISCYGLAIHENTPMFSYVDSPFLASEDEQADMYLYTVETLEHYGYGQYEISNFCLEGFESRHNRKYWNLEDYMGFGCAAHSCVDNIRYGYVSDVSRYISGILEDGKVISEYENTSNLDRAGEYIILGMRTARGISGKEYHDFYRSEFDIIELQLKLFEKHGWAILKDDGRWRFTSSGFLLSNTLIGALLEAQAERKLSTNPWVRDVFDDMKDKYVFPARNKMYTT